MDGEGVRGEKVIKVGVGMWPAQGVGDEVKIYRLLWTMSDEYGIYVIGN